MLRTVHEKHESHEKNVEPYIRCNAKLFIHINVTRTDIDAGITILAKVYCNQDALSTGFMYLIYFSCFLCFSWTMIFYRYARNISK